MPAGDMASEISILSNSFSSHQDPSMEDYIVMLQYNKRV